MDAVELVLRKFDGRPHRQVTGRLLGSDEFGTWLATPRGSVVTYHYGDRRTGRIRTHEVRLIPAGGWWMATFLSAPRKLDVYCDITTPARWSGPAEITVIDLDIDLARFRADGRVVIEDEDEFAEHRETLGYPPDVVEGALAGAQFLRTALTSGEEPFAHRWRDWMARI